MASPGSERRPSVSIVKMSFSCCTERQAFGFSLCEPIKHCKSQDSVCSLYITIPTGVCLLSEASFLTDALFRLNNQST